MAPSALILSILEQAKEPLLCLHGAGYFSEEEWIQLDFIINKKYVWTTGPKLRRFHDDMKDDYNVNKLTLTESGASSNLMSVKEGMRISPSLGGTSPGTSLAPSLDGVETSNSSADTGWELSPTMDSKAPVTAIVGEKTRSVRDPRANGSAVKYNSHPAESMRTLNPTQSKRNNQPILPSAAQKGIEAWASAARNGLGQITRPKQPPISSGTLVDLNDDKIGDSVVAKRIAGDGQHKDVDTFETSNAAEWDEEPVS